ncbi:MAG: PEP-CTERM sorting domain-containing protein, partial [Phycisphaerae bacterium]|nr:PEP-CTERM sorting domain-containing protein [Phycisphaerae bacterium]
SRFHATGMERDSVRDIKTRKEPMMSGKKLICTLGILLLTLMFNTTAFGWGGPSHSALTTITFDDPVVAPLLSLKDAGTDLSAIENFIGEPGDYQNGQWTNIDARAYIDTGVSPNGLDWQGLDETTRLKYMTHNVADVAVPVGHAPACYNPGGYTNTVGEAVLEAQVSLWFTYPNVYGTCNFTNSKTGHSYSYTGTYDEIINTHYNACRDNMTWYKSTPTFLGIHSVDDNRDAGWNGTKLALLLQRMVLVDYFLAKQSPIARASGADRVVYPGQTVHFNASSSYDPDEIIWQSNGTYYNLGTDLETDLEYYWDFNGDGTWDWIDDDPYVNMTYNQLLALGTPTNQWVDCEFWLKDNEGKWACDIDAIYLSTGGAPEPASLSLLAIGGLALIRRKR